MPHKKKKYKTKSAVTLTLALVFLVLATSGIALYLRPEGSIANWTNWTLLGLNKEGWEGVHTIFSSLFIIVVSFHLYFNWKVLMSYFKHKLVAGIRLKRELATALSIVSVFLLIAIFQVDPFWMLMDLRSDIKDGTGIISVQPPVSDAEKLTLSKISDLVGIPSERVIKHLQSLGYNQVDSTTILNEIAEINNISPENLFKVISETPDQ